MDERIVHSSGTGHGAVVGAHDTAVAGTRASSGALTPTEAASGLGAEIVRLMRLVTVWKRRAEKEPGAANRVLLARLVTEGPRRPTDLAADTFLDVSTVSRQVRSLVDRALVERRPDPDDRRGVLLVATDGGRAAYEQYRRQRDAAFEAFLHRWPPEDRYQLVRLMARLNDELVEQHNAPRYPGGHTGMSTDQGETAR